MEEEKNVVEQLENYLDDYTPISIESTIKALDIIYKENKEATTPVFLKIIRHINNRIDEVVNFAYIVSDSRYDEEEKKELAFETLPFKEGDIDVENKIIAAEYKDRESESYEELVVGFLGDARDEYGDIDEYVIEFLHKHDLTFDTIKKIEENNKGHSKTRK